ncbi:MAG: Crp/Fnr family transcriptional regulator [Nitrospinales bacterium]
MKTLYIKKGNDIFEEGSSSDCAYIIESGSVEVSKTMGPGEKKVLGVLQERDIFGELGLVDGLPRTATVTALEDCAVSVLTPETFASLSHRNPKALVPILRILAKRLRATLKMVEDFDNEACAE